MWNWLIRHSIEIKILTEIGTAIGTVGSVIVALWLAYRSNHPKPSIKLEISTLESKLGTYVFINTTNISTAATTIDKIYFKCLFLSKRGAIKDLSLFESEGSFKKVFLSHSQRHSFKVYEQDFLDSAKQFLKMGKCNLINRIKVKCLRIIVEDRLGYKFCCKLSRELQEKLNAERNLN